MKIVLGSTSPFRKALLQRLCLDFICDAPDIDETPLQNEDIEKMVVRLSIAKAKAIAGRHANALIIGSDQSAVLNGEKLSKPVKIPSLQAGDILLVPGKPKYFFRDWFMMTLALISALTSIAILALNISRN